MPVLMRMKLLTGRGCSRQVIFAALAWLVFRPADFTLAADSTLSENRPPNIVMIIADDQRYSDFGFMGNSNVRTPNLDQLARGAALFTNGYVPSSVCRPSLVTLLTGLYPHQHGVHFNHPPPGFARFTKSHDIDKAEFDRLRQSAARLIRSLPTLPRLLAAKGYRCFQTGKYWEGHWRNAGFTEGMTIAEPSGGLYGDKELANGDRVAHGNGDHGLAIGRQTMKPIETFLDDVRQTPFFLWYAPFLPHTPHDAPEKFQRAVKANPRVEPHQALYYASISQFDDTVGQLVRLIDQRGMTNDTLFVFVSDNGWDPDPERFSKLRGEWDHTPRSKRSPFDAGLRTPILIRWAGRTKVQQHDVPLSTVDLMPTLLDAAGIDHDSMNLPGISLWSAAVGAKPLSKNRPVFGEIYPGDASVIGEPERDLAYRWVRRGRQKLIVPRQLGKRTPWKDFLTGPALYDVVQDPDERVDLISDPAMAGAVKDLRGLLDFWWSPDK